MFRIIIALVWLALAFPCQAQMTTLGAGGTVKAAGAAYQGPGDIVSGARFWGSCGRVYTAALASTSTSLCDLVDSAAPTVVICTLRGSSSGKVDLTGTYCTGSVTPATKCAAATGGVCNVSKVYDQTANAIPLTQTTAANQPVLTFSALGGLPCLTSNGSSTAISGASTTPTTTTGSFSTIQTRTGNTTSFNGILQSGTSSGPGYANATNTGLLFQGGTSATFTMTDNAFHALQSVFNGASSVGYVDGSSNALGSPGSNNFAGSITLFEINGGFNLSGKLCEAGFWDATLFSGANNSALNSNQHSVWGF